jgi:hypothetical protein
VKRVSISIPFLLIAVAGCGGGGSATPPSLQPPAVPPTQESAGGIWFGRDSTLAPVTIYAAENGEAKISLSPAGAIVPSFGTGSIALTGGSALEAAFEVSAALTPGSLPTEDLACSLTGMLVSRQSLSGDLTCSDAFGIVYDESLELLFDPNYERPSSLAAIAGNYTVPLRPATNSLNIATDGTISGLYDNGPQCAVNGLVEVIDPDYSLLAVDWTFSACTGPLGIFEGVEMSGFALETPAPTAPPGSYYFLLTGQAALGLYAVSMLFEPQ